MLTEAQVKLLGRVRYVNARHRPLLTGMLIWEPKEETRATAASLVKLGLMETQEAERGGGLFVWITSKGVVAYYAAMQELAPE